MTIKKIISLIHQRRTTYLLQVVSGLILLYQSNARKVPVETSVSIQPLCFDT